MPMTVADLVMHSNRLFARQMPMLNLYQTLANNFYPERADFTVTRNIGSEMADGLADSYPVLMRRDLGGSFGAMLRDGTDWFKLGVRGGAGWMGRMWLQDATSTLSALIHERKSGYARATTQGDHDYATFGQTVLSVEPNKTRSGLIIRNWHLRDCAWEDDEAGFVGQVHRKWMPTAYNLKSIFGDAVHQTTKELCGTGKNPLGKINVRHIVMPADMYGKDEFMRFKNVSIFLDMENQHIIQEVGINYAYYVVPRFQTIAGSPYAYSPATIAGLPNARTLQAMTHTLLEAGERMARPPLVATQKVVNSSVDLGPDGITWVDNEYDERLGQSLRPLFSDKSGFPFGQDMRMGVVEILGKAFYIDKLNLPPIGHEMTAYEVAERMKQFRRENLPLFSPIEADYNGQLCEAALEVAMTFKMLGSEYDIPVELQDKDTEFQFDSPLKEQEEEKKVQQFRMTGEAIAEASQFDPGVRHNVNFDMAMREAIEANGSPARWLRDVEQVTQMRAIDQAAAMAQGQMEAA